MAGSARGARGPSADLPVLLGAGAAGGESRFNPTLGRATCSRKPGPRWRRTPFTARFQGCLRRMCQTGRAGYCPQTWARSQPCSTYGHALPSRCTASRAPGPGSHSLSPLTCASCGVFCSPQPSPATDLPFPPRNLMTLFHVKHRAALPSQSLYLVFGEKLEGH